MADTLLKALSRIHKAAPWFLLLFILAGVAYIIHIAPSGSLSFGDGSGDELRAWLESPLSEMKVWHLLLVLYVIHFVFDRSK